MSETIERAYPHAPTADDAPLDTAALAVCTTVLQQGAADLRRRFGPVLGEAVVDRQIEDSLEELRRSGVPRTHRESTAIHFAESRLLALAETTGVVEPSIPRVLFVCLQNAGRSQLAAALLAERAGDAVRVSSAGSRPTPEVHDDVAPVLSEIGADPAAAYPKPVTPELLAATDYVISLGCSDECRERAGVEVRDWPVGDPAEADWERLQEIVADIERRVDALWAEIQGRFAA